MKRNAIGLIKFFILAGFVVLLTVVVFRLMRQAVPAIKVRDHWNKLPVENHGDNVRPQESPFKRDPDVLDIKDQEEKIDWHDYAKIEEDKKRRGIGEQGKPGTLSPALAAKKERLYEVNGFNAALSDEISLNRSLPDIRHRDCQKKKYSSKLDSVSVIVSFHNEHFTTLLRTCWSVINRSPSHLLLEIVLVDDASTKIELKKKLDDYVKKNLPKVRIIRLSERSGLIRGRLAGAKQARAKVLIFLDSHSEANVNWLPPLLDPMAKNYKICVCPFIDVVAFDTFEYRAQDEGARGAFDWEFYYKRLPLLPEDLKRPAEPFKSPIMAGGLFAITAKFFWELGGYDTGLDIWGGEQYELSFKIWQCGGEMYDAPCSRVGHIYRKFAPFPNPRGGDFLSINYKRVAEVWMDEYASYIYKRKPALNAIDPGDLTAQKARRKNLNCKPFKWFMENVAFDLVKVYPPVEPEDMAHGEIRSLKDSNLCLDSKGRGKDETVTVDKCSKNDPTVTGEQKFRLTFRHDIRPKDRAVCFDVSQPNDGAPVAIYPCHGQKGNQFWRYDVDVKWLKQGFNERCLDVDPIERRLFMSHCDSSSVTQKWKFEIVNEEQMKKQDTL